MPRDNADSKSERLLRMAIERFDGLTGAEFRMFAQAGRPNNRVLMLGYPMSAFAGVSAPEEPNGAEWWESIRGSHGPEQLRIKISALSNLLEFDEEKSAAQWSELSEAAWYRVVRADRLTWLITDPEAARLLPPGGVFLYGAIIPDAVNWEDTIIRTKLILSNSYLGSLISANDCRARLLAFRSCILDGHICDDVDKNRFLTSRFYDGIRFSGCLIRSPILLTGCRSGGTLSFDGCRLGTGNPSGSVSKPALCLLAHGMNVASQFRIVNSVCFGAVEVHGLHCGGQALFCNSDFRGGRNNDGVFHALNLFEARIEESVFFRSETTGESTTPTTIRGPLDFSFARVSGLIDCSGVRLQPALDHDQKLPLLDFDHAVVSHDLRLSGPPLSDKESCDRNPTGSLRLSNLRVRGDLIFENMSIDGNNSDAPVNFNNTTVDGCFNWRGVKCGDAASLDLRHAKVGEFYDEPSSWPQPGKLQLDGFTYGALTNTDCRSFRDRLRWLQLQPGDLRTPWWKTVCYLPAIHYNPQPFDQLADSLQRTGDEDDARAVLIEKFKLRGRSLSPDTGPHGKLAAWVWALGFAITFSYALACPVQQIGEVYTWLLIHALAAVLLILSGAFPWRRWWQFVLYVTIGYGYRTGLSVLYLAGLLLLGAGIFWSAYRLEYTVPSDPDVLTSAEYRDHLAVPRDYPKFQPIIFSLDTMLPFVDLQQETRWTIIGHAQRTGTTPFISTSGSNRTVAALPVATQETASSIRRSREPTSHVLGRFFRFYLWGHIAAGWLLTTLLLAGLTGIARQR